MMTDATRWLASDSSAAPRQLARWALAQLDRACAALVRACEDGEALVDLAAVVGIDPDDIGRAVWPSVAAVVEAVGVGWSAPPDGRWGAESADHALHMAEMRASDFRVRVASDFRVHARHAAACVVWANATHFAEAQAVAWQQAARWAVGAHLWSPVGAMSAGRTLADAVRREVPDLAGRWEAVVAEWEARR